MCADVIVTNPGGVIPPHTHSIPQPTSSTDEQNELSLSPDSSGAALLGAPMQTRLGVSYPAQSQSSSSLSSRSVSPLLTKDQQEVLQAVPKLSQ